MTPRSILLSLSCSALLLACAQKESAKKLPRVCEVRPFLLWDANEEEFGLDRVKGKIWVADFIFTHCTYPCPIMTAGMKKLQDAFADQDDVQFVSVSVDPGRDSPEVLKTYARTHGAIDGKWHFATGSPQEIQKLQAEGMKLLTNPDNPLQHNVKFVLVDRSGTVRGYYDGKEPPEVKQLEKDIRRLLEEPRP